MKRLPLVLLTALTLCGSASGSAQAASLCVDHRPGCFRELQPAVDAAHDGDTLRVGPGTYRGGVTIAVSVEVRGAGAQRTRIHGGGPVVTIAADAGEVAISGLTISGGVTTATGAPHIALGGGVFIPSREDDGPGATVTIDHSVIAHNLAAPSVAITPGFNEGCPECPFAVAFGGGIYNEGDLTLTRTTVARNRVAGPVTSVPEGGGIFSPGPLTLDRSHVIGNEAHGQPPNGREAGAGGLYAHETGLTIRHSLIAGNRAVFESRWPIGDRSGALAGGVFVDGDFTLHPGVQATIEHSRIEGNGVRSFNPVGDAIAFSGGVHANGAVAITDSVVGHNRAVGVVPPGSPATAAADSAAGNLNVGAAITRVRFVGNAVVAHAPDGTAVAGAGALWAFADAPLDVRDSLFAGNRVTAIGHSVDAFGAGLVNTDVLALSSSRIEDNALRASGSTGTARGGGIWNGHAVGFDIVPQLNASDSTVTGNAIVAARAIEVHGGGVFTEAPVTLARVLIRRNRPDDGCFGCVAGLSRAANPVQRAMGARRAARLDAHPWTRLPSTARSRTATASTPSAR